MMLPKPQRATPKRVSKYFAAEVKTPSRIIIEVEDAIKHCDVGLGARQIAETLAARSDSPLKAAPVRKRVLAKASEPDATSVEPTKSSDSVAISSDSAKRARTINVLQMLNKAPLQTKSSPAEKEVACTDGSKHSTDDKGPTKRAAVTQSVFREVAQEAEVVAFVAEEAPGKESSNRATIVTSQTAADLEDAVAQKAMVGCEVSEDASSFYSVRTYDLKLGEVGYTCVCTCDPDVASAWAAAVSVEIDAAEGQRGILGLDCEWAAPWHRGPDVPDRLATVQFFHCGAAGMRALVFSVAKLGAGALPAAVDRLLSDRRLAKVGVNVAGDANRLTRDFGSAVHGLYDLCNLNSKPGEKLRKSVSLEDIVRTHCPQEMHITKSVVALSKGVRTSNWEAWPLSLEQVEYAARDVALSVLAFMHRFGMVETNHLLSSQAMKALQDAEEAEAESGSKVVAGQSKRGAEAKGDEGAAEARKTNKPNFFMAMRNSVLSPPNLGKKEHPQGPHDALQGVCVIVSGVLDSFDRADFEEYVKSHGGTIAKGVNKKVTHLVTDHGEAGPSKLAKCKELGIPSVSEDVILQLVDEARARAL